MSEGPDKRRLQFKIHHLLILTAIVAALQAFISYRLPGRPLVAAMSGMTCIVALVIVGVACLLPERYGRWLRPLAVVISGAIAFAFGLWAQNNL
jgi:hypothetical protein